MILIQHVLNSNYEAVLALLLNNDYTPSEDEKKLAILAAVDRICPQILSILLADEKKRFDPSLDDNLALMNTIYFHNNNLLAILLADSRVNPAVRDNAPIRLSSGFGNTEAVRLLLESPRVNPSACGNAAMFCALAEGHSDIVKLLLPHLKLAGVPWTNFIDPTLDDSALLDHIGTFLDDPKEYISKISMTTDAQCAALEMLMLQDLIHKLEKKQLSAMADEHESAMDDSKVIKSRQFFEIVRAHYISTFNQFGDSDLARVIAIEKQIRGMILNAIESETANEEQRIFITLNRKKLTSSSDERIMKIAREKYFNTQSAAHVAWRGYDVNAPYKGDHFNLLTPPPENIPIFSTRASSDKEVLSATASDEIRKMMAFYYLLATDPNEPELLVLRKTNFIAELADLRLAHQADWSGEDAPSCYPGYFGRALNLSFGHSLSQHLVTPKTVIMEYLSPIILQEFTSVLQEGTSAEFCEHLLQALSWLTLTQASQIVLNKMDYPENLLPMRNAFTKALSQNRKAFYQDIDKLLQEKGLAPLDDIGRKFVKLCLLDPAREINFGRLGAVYSSYIQAKYPTTPLKPMTLVAAPPVNPFKAQYVAAKKLGNMQPDRLASLKRKSQLFKKLKQDIEARAKHELAADENTFDSKGMVLLLKVAITEMPNTNLDTPALFNDTFEQTLKDNAHCDEAFPQALHILHIFRNCTSTKKPLPMAESPSKAINFEQTHIKPSVVKKLFKN